MLYVISRQKNLPKYSAELPSLYSYIITLYRTIYSRLVSMLYAAAGSIAISTAWPKKTRRELLENVASSLLACLFNIYRIV